MARGRVQEDLSKLEANDPKVKAAVRGLEEVTSKFAGRNYFFGPNYYLPIGEWRFDEPVEVDLSHPMIQAVLEKDSGGKFVLK